MPRYPRTLNQTRIEDRTCPVCNKVLSRRYDLKRHLKQHDDKKEFACLICGKEMRQKCNIVNHVRTIHGLDNAFSTRCWPTRKGKQCESTAAAAAPLRFDSVEGIEEMTRGFDSFTMQSIGRSEGYSTLARGWVKAEEEPDWSLHLDEDMKTASTSYTSQLSPSASSYASTPTPSTPQATVEYLTTAYPTTAYPTTAYPTTTIEPIPVQPFDFSADFQHPEHPEHPQFLSTHLYNYYIGYCTEQLCAATNQQDATAVQYWYTCLGAVVEAYGVPEAAGTPDQAPADDMYYNVPGWGQSAPEPVLENFEEPPVQPEAIDSSNFDFSGDVNYFDASWSAPIPMNNFEALYGLSF